MNKRKFETPVIEMVECSELDVIRTSGDVGGGEIDPWGVSLDEL